MKLIYIAGPYRGNTIYDTLCNIMRARDAALDVWRLGHCAICPHSNTALFDGAYGLKHEDWLAGGIEMLKRCDGVYLCEGWEHSAGTLEEMRVARRLGIPIYYSLRQLVDAIGGIAK